MDNLKSAISIVICTRNRAAAIERCLLHIAGIDHSELGEWELIVVDNHSGDGTRDVFDNVARSTELPLKYVFEARPGLSHARNRGIAEARYPIIAFTDDDCLIAPDWATTIVRTFARDPFLAIVGGRVELENPQDLPIGIRSHRESVCVTKAGQLLELMIGCNMAFSREVFDAIRLFDASFGSGTRIGAAEDLDLMFRALKYGMKIVYLSDMVVRHAHGRSLEAAQDIKHGYVRGRGAFYVKHWCDPEILQLAYWEVRHLLQQRRKAGGAGEKFLSSLASGAALKLFGRSGKADNRRT